MLKRIYFLVSSRFLLPKMRCIIKSKWPKIDNDFNLILIDWLLCITWSIFVSFSTFFRASLHFWWTLTHYDGIFHAFNFPSKFFEQKRSSGIKKRIGKKRKTQKKVSEDHVNVIHSVVSYDLGIESKSVVVQLFLV